LVSSSSQEGGSTGVQVTTLPDPTRPQKWIIVLLMGAALAYGLLTALIPAKEAQPAEDSRAEELRKSLADLEKRHAAGGLSTKSYRKKKGELQAQLNRASGSKKP
jgi:cytochrome c-type biogenesis protein CcmH/NrfG